MSQQAIPGYTYGTSAVPHSPLSLEEFERLKQTILFRDEDSHALRRSYDILHDQVEAILDVWYGFVASHPFLVHFFSDRATDQPDGAYLAAVRKRFGQWILDTAKADYDQAWLDYQYEIGLRHTRAGKNRTDGVNSVDHVSYRYLPALLYPVTATLKPFLAKKGHNAEEVDKMQQAWVKSVLLQIILWSQHYIKDGEF